jgi:hypothetical protein
MSLLEQALLHLPHIGSVRAAKLRGAGCDSWQAILAAPAPAGLAKVWPGVQAEAARCLAALQADDLRMLVGRLPTADHWRVLAHGFENATYFDIETSGLDARSVVTLICCLHRGRVYRFLRGENLDDFLTLLDEVSLLVSFNGTGFDVPRVEDLFHVQELPCAHVDLRWMCHHHGWRGGLKLIEGQLGLRRPADLHGLGGEQAVWLWQVWERERVLWARRTLERYCAADTVVLKLLAAELLTAHGCGATVPEAEALWTHVNDEMPPVAGGCAYPAAAPAVVPPATAALGQALSDLGGLSREAKQARLRARWRAMRNG